MNAVGGSPIRGTTVLAVRAGGNLPWQAMARLPWNPTIPSSSPAQERYGEDLQRLHIGRVCRISRRRFHSFRQT